MTDPQWKGLFEWTMRHTDGTSVADLSRARVDPEKMAWLQNVLENYVTDLVTRLQEIKTTLEEPENKEGNTQQQEALLDELQEIVKDIDQAKSKSRNSKRSVYSFLCIDLHLIGGVPLLVDLLQSSQTTLRWRAAEVVATCVQNNQEVQKAFFEEGIFPLIFAVALNADLLCQVKGWMAVSCLVRNFQPGLQAFFEAQGLQHLLTALDSDDLRLQRRGLLLLDYLLTQNNNLCQETIQDDKTLHRLVNFLDSEDLDVRERVLGVFTAIANTSEGKNTLQSHHELQHKLTEAEKTWDASDAEERERHSSEKSLLCQLRNILQDARSAQQA